MFEPKWSRSTRWGNLCDDSSMSARQITIIANWKANLPPSDEVDLARRIAEGLRSEGRHTVEPSRLRLLLAPSTLGLVPVASLIRREFPTSGLQIAAQDVSAGGPGAFTGESPADHLVAIASAVIVGHSERRRDHHESAEVVGRKLARVARAGLAPVLCLGDDLPNAETEVRVSLVQSQCAQALDAAAQHGCAPRELLAAGLAIAYEPIWAIGTGRPASLAIGEEIARGLRASTGMVDLAVLYGGSVEAAAAASWLGTSAGRTEIDGLLVGGASLEEGHFLAIVRAAARAAGGA